MGHNPLYLKDEADRALTMCCAPSGFSQGATAAALLLADLAKENGRGLDPPRFAILVCRLPVSCP